MHELSIANNIVNIAAEAAARHGATRVQAVDVSIGALSCVHEDALRFSFDIVAENSILAGAQLRIRRVPLAVFCASCDRVVDVAGIQDLRCPTCHTPSNDIRRGQELDVDSIEFSSTALRQ
jgi:hydrogenase nickel incorporation protein HypA/HybF